MSKERRLSAELPQVGQLTFCTVDTEEATDETEEATEAEALIAAVFAIEFAVEEDFIALLISDSKKDPVGLSIVFIIRTWVQASFNLCLVKEEAVVRRKQNIEKQNFAFKHQPLMYFIMPTLIGTDKGSKDI